MPSSRCAATHTGVVSDHGGNLPASARARKASVTLDRTAIPTVAVFGRDTVVGQALELLLRSADCNVRFIAEFSLGEPGLLDGVQLLLLAPGLSTECYETLLALVDSQPSVAIPILELVDDDREAQVGETQVGSGHFAVPWPCRAEKLKRQMEAALLAGSGASQDSGALRK